MLKTTQLSGRRALRWPYLPLLNYCNHIEGGGHSSFGIARCVCGVRRDRYLPHIRLERVRSNISENVSLSYLSIHIRSGPTRSRRCTDEQRRLVSYTHRVSTASRTLPSIALRPSRAPRPAAAAAAVREENRVPPGMRSSAHRSAVTPTERV